MLGNVQYPETLTELFLHNIFAEIVQRNKIENVDSELCKTLPRNVNIALPLKDPVFHIVFACIAGVIACTQINAIILRLLNAIHKFQMNSQ